MLFYGTKTYYSIYVCRVLVIVGAMGVVEAPKDWQQMSSHGHETMKMGPL